MMESWLLSETADGKSAVVGNHTKKSEGELNMNIKQKQLRNNVEQVLDEYLNGMYDYPEDYPEMTIEECRKYVTEQIYDMKSDGRGHTFYRNGICDDLRFLGNEYIYKVIDEYAIGNGIIKG